MTILFRDEMHNEFGTWPLSYIPYGGADFGELKVVADSVGEGDDSAFYQAWTASADRLVEQAEDTVRKGHRQSARDLFLRASTFYAASYHPLYGCPVDPRLLHAFRKQVAALDRGLALSTPAVVPMRISFEGTTLPAYLLPATAHEAEVRPLLIFNNGYDATVTDMYFSSGVAATRRGYHCLLFDGPGQGEMLYEHGISLRPDWETVIRAVVDFALTQPIVDPQRIALMGWSLGGHLAPRAASAEHRISALIADPATWSIAEGMRSFAIHKLGVSPAAAASLADLDDVTMAKLETIIRGNRQLSWKVVQRGFWVHGTPSLREYLRSAAQFTMDGRAENIQCPTLLTMAEQDSLAVSAPQFFEALRCPKTLLRFRSAEGAGEHCEMGNRSLLNRRVFDWLDELFGTPDN